jgi:hypothetical protein
LAIKTAVLQANIARSAERHGPSVLERADAHLKRSKKAAAIAPRAKSVVASSPSPRQN